MRFSIQVCVLTFFVTFYGYSDSAAQWQRYQDAEVINTSDVSVEWTKFNDEDTGYEVWRMTSSDAGTWHGHFNTQSFTSDDRFVVFSSERTGDWQLYRVDLDNGEIRQLTDVESLSNSTFTVHPNGEEVYFSFDGILGRANIYSGEIHRAEFDEAVTFRRVISNDGNYTVVTSSDGNSSTIYLISLSDPKVEAKLHWPSGTTLNPGVTWTGSISHPMINPGYPWIVAFLPASTHREETDYYDHQRDMTLPMKLRARVWTWDARTGEVGPLITMPYHYSQTHESWSRSGDRYFFFQKAAPGWVPNHIASVDRHGNDWQNHHTDTEIRLGHGSSSDDGKWFISDGQDPGRNPMRLINLETGKWEDLAWPDASISGPDGMSGHAVQGHPHPSFSSSGNFVTYTSNATGSSEVYVIPIPEDLKQNLSSTD